MESSTFTCYSKHVCFLSSAEHCFFKNVDNQTIHSKIKCVLYSGYWLVIIGEPL